VLRGGEWAHKAKRNCTLLGFVGVRERRGKKKEYGARGKKSRTSSYRRYGWDASSPSSPSGETNGKKEGLTRRLNTGGILKNCQNTRGTSKKGEAPCMGLVCKSLKGNMMNKGKKESVKGVFS